MLNTYRKQGLPEINVNFWCLCNSGSPRDKHHERASSQRKSGGEPREREGIQHLLVVDIEHHIQSPPGCKVDSNLDFLGSLSLSFSIKLNADWYGLGTTSFVCVALA
nr:hypothetical protein Itr_chr03CG21110 [Ipomoea trifida]